ncbi:hypothetical protein B0F90DRAFT_1675408 [Multifurca ochricompacta]|uniref:Uncharacterized protein n=1 Tax=Multifurca ochricompacta TaxID=376703 RepID=A0AAD4MC45_9AGAM|nr:hypothetical protein B0F90DRAFT_1675408 [Multifurca ochricompacta]
MFRASPWITYDPPVSDSPMDNDTEMDAPQISTLHDDAESPPSNTSPARTGKFRVKLLVNETKMGTKFITFNGETGEEAGVGEEPEEEEPEEDEEDELIDDEEDTSAPAPSNNSGPTLSHNNKSGSKRPPAKPKSSQAKRKGRLSATAAATPVIPTTLSSQAQTNQVQDAPSVEPSPAAPQVTSAPPAPASKRKAVPKGTTAAQRAPRKSAAKPKATAPIPPPTDLTADFSEGHAGTVPSSPAHADPRTPEPEATAPLDTTSISAPPAPETSTLEDLEGVPHPRYPLPTKPFQVQLPPKISTGYAPVIPLDRTKNKARHWRLAHREIRGIAGGRWFTRSWVGEKDSELAVAAEAALSLPKLPALSISAPVSGTRAAGKRKPKADAVSTAASSRSASVAPEGAAPSAPLQRSATKRSALSTTVATSEVDMDIDLVS